MDSNIVLASKVVELSEEKDYLVLKNRVCFFDSENLNKVQLDYNEDTLSQCQSLINTPLVAKYVKRNGKDDLGGHEVKLVKGKYEFQTQAVGVNTAIDIIEEEVELVDGSTAKLPCLYCTEILWTRFKNVTNAVKRLFAEGKLHNSWELKSSEYTFKDGIKHIKKYTFIGNCLLGTESFPAYGKSAAVVEMSDKSDNYECMAAEQLISEALEMDIASMPASDISDSNRREENETMNVDENLQKGLDTSDGVVEESSIEEDTNVNTQDQGEPDVHDNSEGKGSEHIENEETSAMKTFEDIYRMLRVAVNELNRDEWCNISMVFPEDKIILVSNYKMNTLQFIKYSYRIDGDKAILEDEEDVELVVSPLKINSEIESRNNAIAEANNRIAELQAQINELAEAKKELDCIKEEQAKIERAEAVSKLRKYVEDSGRFTSEELNGGEVNKAIEDLDEAWIKAEIADRFMASISNQSQPEVSQEVEVSESKKNVAIVLSENEQVTPEDVMREFFK